jgi:hypothetical protein
MCSRRSYWYPASGGQQYYIGFRKTLPRNFLKSHPFGQLAEDFAGSDEERMA